MIFVLLLNLKIGWELKLAHDTYKSVYKTLKCKLMIVKVKVKFQTKSSLKIQKGQQDIVKVKSPHAL